MGVETRQTCEEDYLFAFGERSASFAECQIGSLFLCGRMGLMLVWIYALVSVFLVSLLSFIGVLFLAFKKACLEKLLLFLVSLAAGGLLGGAFIHLLPETAEGGFSLNAALLVLIGILVFFVLEKFLFWRHCHVPTSKNHPHPLAFMNLAGDAFHNFIDGLLIGGSFLASLSLGLATTLAVVLHEIPQEIGDFGVLVYAGLSKNKALLFNFASGLVAILGVIVALGIGSKVVGFSQVIIPFTAGGFIYIAGTDLLPELKKETNFKKSLLQFLGLVLGIAFMLLLTKFC